MKQIYLILAIAIIALSCQKEDKAGDGKIYIVTTTGMIADAVQNVAGETAFVEALMGPGVDPHLYKTSQGDLGKLRQGEMIFYNGLHLEGKMGEVLEKLGRQKPVIAIADGLGKEQLIASEGSAYAHDPHIWFDVALWAEAVRYISQKLQEKYPENAAIYKKNAEAYISELNELHEWVKEEISTIPQEQRVLITAHDAFEYFGKAYDIEVRGLQGISTISEYGLQDITNMTEFIAERNIKAVFVESSVPEKALKAVVDGAKHRGHEVRIGGTLYSDAMGAEGTPEGKYIGMVRSNVNIIVSSLK